MTQPTVLVLAGGASTRFWPLRDKLFMELGGQCLLERHLRMLRDLGCERFILVARPDTAERAESIGKALGVDPSTSSGQSLRVVVQAEARGMADAVLAARPALETLGDGAVYVTQAHDVVEKRRRSAYFIPIARPRKRGAQRSFETEWTGDRVQENTEINVSVRQTPS